MAEMVNKVALVVGGTSGIGRASAEALLAAGASVAVCGVGDDVTRSCVESLEVAYGADRVHGSTVDVTDEVGLSTFVNQSADHFGGLDVLVCAAGIQTYGSAADTDLAAWKRTFDVNLTGAFLAVKYAVPHLRSRRGGSIVLVSSVQGFACQSDVAAYSTSKAALNALVRSIAVDEAVHGIRANAVCPASVDTPMLRASARQFSDGTDAGEQAVVDQWGAAHPLGRVARASEIGDAVAYLASERSSFITGISLPVDGGLTARLAVSLADR
ncbi:short-chain dehydrogenase [Rhodococcoides trifolii]|uniref:Short-chain dehydrogenase n=1 Tax=Rhodococcoides trifolii TaxID=908250 RepID=A0A917CWF7_9NOCA|nr:SDR family oxidoreductase [Rhodococcus trifolii]GGF99986.1 short-chain dehydrogenase [Rhodococcus trifolii]